MSFHCCQLFLFFTLFFTHPHFCQSSPDHSIDCNFDSTKSGSEFCGWSPGDMESVDLFRIGNAVVIDSANSVSKYGDGDDNFLYANGAHETSTGFMESPEIFPAKSDQSKELKLNFWKVSSTPILDICVKDTTSGFDLNCLDSVSGPGPQQWVRKSIRIPTMATPFKIVLRVRNIHSAEDIVAVDDIQLVDVLPVKRMKTKQKFKQLIKPESRRRQESAQTQWSTSSGSQRAENGDLVIPRNEFKLAEQKFLDAPSGSNGFLMPLKINKFAMSHSTVKPFENPLMNGFSGFGLAPVGGGLQVNAPEYNAPSFPSFPSFSQGMNPGFDLSTPNQKLPDHAKIAEDVSMCKAVKCSFLDDTCLWKLGPSWKRSDGNIAMEVGGEDIVTSSKFKSPLGSYMEFDLWMSDDSFFTVYETMDGIDVMLFSRQGMSNNGWHRFRIPLRPSFVPVQIKFKNSLPPGGFITLSNTRLVDANGEEVSCETVSAEASMFFPQMMPPPPPNQPASLFAPSPPILMPQTPIVLRDSSSSMGSNMDSGVSAFGGNVFEGVKPIEPMKDDPQRLTALQGYNPKMLISTTPEPYLLPDLPPQRPSFPKISAETRPIQVASTGTAFFPQTPDKSQSNHQQSGDLLSRLGASPDVEQQLRDLAGKFGFDTDKMPDPQTFNVLKRFLGSKLMSQIPQLAAASQAKALDIPDNMKPIKPVNVDDADYERVYRDEMMKHSVQAISTSRPMQAEFLNGFANLIPPPETKQSHDSPFARQNLDFAYQNALHG